jgi:hypothetical protein
MVTVISREMSSLTLRENLGSVRLIRRRLSPSAPTGERM